MSVHNHDLDPTCVERQTPNGLKGACMTTDPRFSDYWAAIRADLNKQTVDAVIRLADNEQEGLRAALNFKQGIIDDLAADIVAAEAKLAKVRALADDGWWSDTHRCDVIMQHDLRAALDES